MRLVDGMMDGRMVGWMDIKLFDSNSKMDVLISNLVTDRTMHAAPPPSNSFSGSALLCAALL